MLVNSVNCCPTIRLSGAQRSELNKVYTITSKKVNDRPTYIDSFYNYGMWWDRTGHWRIGTNNAILQYRNKYTMTSTWMKSDQDASCPSHLDQWQEYTSEWAVNVKSHVSCDDRINRNRGTEFDICFVKTLHNIWVQTFFHVYAWDILFWFQFLIPTRFSII